MNYYPFHIGDYATHTAHLEPLEDLAYRRLLDLYYLREGPLPVDIQEVARLVRMRKECDIVERVLNEFFKEFSTGWIHERCDAELSRMIERQTKARASAEASVNARKAKALRTQSDGTADAERTLNERSTTVELPTPTPTPIPILSEEAYASLSGSSFPPCPHSQILELYAKHLPHLPQHRTWEGRRQANLRARWVQASKPSSLSTGYKTGKDGLDWWSSFFEFIANDTKLAKGFESNGRVWVPDLEWMVKAENFNKIIDGKYNK